MKVTIVLAESLFPKGAATLEFERGVTEAGPSGTFFKVVQQLEEETAKSGLVVRVGGARKHTWVPASSIRRVEVVE